MKKCFYLIFLYLTLSADLKAETQLSIAPALLFFDYTEFGFDDSVLNNETGTIPGVQLHLNTAINDQLNIELELTRYDGDVAYNGYSQSGTAINTTTDENILRYGLRIITPLFDNTEIFLATSMHQWKRDIQGKGSILGIFEKYQWQEIAAGIKTRFQINKHDSWSAEVALLKIINPDMYIDLSEADLGSTTLKLNAETGARFQLSWLRTSSNNRSYEISAFYEMRDFDMSDSGATSGGASSVSVYEPRSESKHSGIQFNLGFQY
ncbi:MAG: hypothetical protein OEM07_01930 [Gammaproteobacteria bacterium]|nr:hypothetical protein [Gammaproteobacteria bacterium]